MSYHYKVFDIEEAYLILKQAWKERRKWNKLYGNKSIVYNTIIIAIINQIRKLKNENKNN